MGAGQRGLADILPSDCKESSEAGTVSRFLSAAGAVASSGDEKRDLDEAGVLREQVSVFESQVRQLIAQINWLQENLELEEESRLGAENQAESLRQACSEQTSKVEELSEQIGMLFQDLDEQHKHWTSLEAKLEFEQQERLHIEATRRALAAGAVDGFLSPSSPQNNVVSSSDGWSSAQASPTPSAAPPGFRVSWDTVEYEGDVKTSSSKAVSMFKELNSEWSNYKSEGKLGNWSLAKVLRRLSFSDAKKKKSCGANKSGSDTAVFDSNSGDASRAFDTAKLTEEIFSINSEASEVRQRHLADLRNKLETRMQIEDRDGSSEAWSDYPKARFKSAKMSKSVSRSSSKKLGSQKSFELETKDHFKIESLGRQVFHLKKLCTEKTQLVKLEKRRRNEVENRYYALVKNLEKQVLQLRKMNLRKADEVKQERCRRQEAEKRSVAEVETLQRQVVKLSKLADARAHDFKHEQKQRLEAQKRLKDLLSQLKTTRQTKPQRCQKTKQVPTKNSLLSPLSEDHQDKPVELVDDETLGRGELVELEALQFRTLGTSESPSSERQLWKLQTRQKGRIVLTPLPNAIKTEPEPEPEPEPDQQEGKVEQDFREADEVQMEEAGPNMNSMESGGANVTQVPSDNESSDSLSVATPQQVREEKGPADTDASSGSPPRPASLTGKISQLKETTTRLLKDLEGTQMLMNAPATAGSDSGVIESGGDREEGGDIEQGIVFWSPAPAPGRCCRDHRDYHLRSPVLEMERGFRGGRGSVSRSGDDFYSTTLGGDRITDNKEVDRDCFSTTLQRDELTEGEVARLTTLRSNEIKEVDRDCCDEAARFSKGWMKAKVELMLRLVFDRHEGSSSFDGVLVAEHQRCDHRFF